MSENQSTDLNIKFNSVGSAEDRQKMILQSPFAGTTSIETDVELNTPSFIGTMVTMEGFRREDRSEFGLNGYKYVDVRTNDAVFVVNGNRIDLLATATPAAVHASSVLTVNSNAKVTSIEGPLSAEVNHSLTSLNASISTVAEATEAESSKINEQRRAHDERMLNSFAQLGTASQSKNQHTEAQQSSANQSESVNVDLDQYLSGREAVFSKKMQEIAEAAEGHPDVIAAQEAVEKKAAARHTPMGKSVHEPVEKHLEKLKAKAAKKEEIYGISQLYSQFNEQQEQIKATGKPLVDDPYAPKNMVLNSAVEQVAGTKMDATAAEQAGPAQQANQAPEPAKAVTEDSVQPKNASRDHVISGPTKIGNYDRQENGEYKHATTGNVDFIDRGANKISVKSSEPEAVEASIQLVKSKGWHSVDISKVTNKERQQALAVEALANDIHVNGYVMQPEDLIAAGERKKAIQEKGLPEIKVSQEKTVIETDKELTEKPEAIDFHVQKNGTYETSDAERGFAVSGSKIEISAQADERTVAAAMKLCKQNGVDEVAVSGPIAKDVYTIASANYEMKITGYQPNATDRIAVDAERERTREEAENVERVTEAEQAPPDLSIKSAQEMILERTQQSRRDQSRS